ncbi:MAG: type II toxin-antitoxin system RelE/ParE family toxin [Chloroflexi bacterium]|nr:type II toxin-antitoxin system RelE/ParE family toxin [Chloroflexota bacterium]
MSLVLEFLPEAAAEVAAATEYYEARVPGLGVRFRREIESACGAVVQHPLLWRERPGGYRRVNLPGFPYYIAYFMREERILVAAVGHASRHPDYWKGRRP